MDKGNSLTSLQALTNLALMERTHSKSFSIDNLLSSDKQCSGTGLSQQVERVTFTSSQEQGRPFQTYPRQPETTVQQHCRQADANGTSQSPPRPIKNVDRKVDG